MFWNPLNSHKNPTLGLVCLLFTHVVFAESYEIQPVESIRESIKKHLEQSIQAPDFTSLRVRVGELDERLRLAKCTKPLEIFLPPGTPLNTATTVGVKCTHEKRWTIYVSVQTEILGTVWTAAKPLITGVELKNDDITASERDLKQLNRGYFLDKTQILGKILNRDLSLGEVINPQAISIPEMIKRGDQVLITANMGNIRVEMMGIALTAGGKGQLVRVKNLSSEREIDAVVVSPSRVKVTL